jgi:2-(1,2-epoxy-1,2-dihydrophenyl)acetyl-CoA isomerase
MEAVVVERRERVAVLRLNQPESMNALSPDIKAALDMHVGPLMDDAGVGCIVLTGTGKAFCAGGDIRAMSERKPANVRARLRAGHRWVRQLVEGEKPVVGAVNGAAAGAGLSLALMCDVVVAGRGATFRGGFSGIGAAPDLGVAYALPRAVGMVRAKEILLNNRVLTADEALAYGLVGQVVEDGKLMEEALATAQRLASGPMSIGLAKMLLNRAYDGGLDAFLLREADAQAMAFSSDDFAEGVAAFLAKRRPRFGKGREEP